MVFVLVSRSRRVVPDEGSFVPYMQYCPCEASEQKLGQKTKICSKENRA